MGFIASSSGRSIIVHDDEGYSSMPSRTKRLRRQQQLENMGISSLPLSVSSSLAVMAANVDREKDYCGRSGEDFIHQDMITYHPYDDDDCGDKSPSPKPKPKRSWKAVEPSGYWIDEIDPFVMVMNDDDVFVNGRGDQGSIISSIDPDMDSAPFTTQPLQQQQQSSERLIITSNDIHSNEKNVNNNEHFTDRYSHQKSIKFTIRGNPRVLIRHRSARGYTYNPSRPAQQDFRNCLSKLLPPMMFHHHAIQTTTTSTNATFNATIRSRKIAMVDHENNDNGTINEMDPSSSTPSSPITLFSKDECLKLSITFRMKRPKSHFKANQPGHGRLKSSAPSKLCIRNLRSDIDNMAKFVMDSLNGLLYVDDRQVVELNVKKVLDCEGLCLGATDVEIWVVKDDV